ncbi:MAG: hypothetical protein PWP27_870 [Clostridiales bacterium]|jgi:hypothetical protein|nr:hypothetical protein [Clostridiales bacterium]MDK2933060.1 hypothetical protein [Clostridiales bacterium]
MIRLKLKNYIQSVENKFGFILTSYGILIHSWTINES